MTELWHGIHGFTTDKYHALEIKSALRRKLVPFLNIRILETSIQNQTVYTNYTVCQIFQAKYVTNWGRAMFLSNYIGRCRCRAEWKMGQIECNTDRNKLSSGFQARCNWHPEWHTHLHRSVPST